MKLPMDQAMVTVGWGTKLNTRNPHAVPHRAEEEFDYDAPHRRRHELLPNHARCETCAHWCGWCLAADARKMTRAEDRCDSWVEHADYARLVGWAKGEHPIDKRREHNGGQRPKWML